MLSLDPAKLCAWQLDRDRERTKTYPGMFEHKLERMRASPLAFLRGAAPLYYELIATRPELAKGPPGEGWIAGDLHLENFGAYRPHTHAADDVDGAKRPASEIAAFGMNDFDDAVIGPMWFDTLRLVTSLILGGREVGADGPHTLDLCDTLLESYVAHLAGRAAMPPTPRPVANLIEVVLHRTRRELLDARTETVRGSRRFIRGHRYKPLARATQREAERAFGRYVERLDDDERASASHFEVLDMAFRVAGTGSLGGLRIAVLTRGKDGPDGAWVFDMKEEGRPSAARVLGSPKRKPAKRVITALRACLAHPPRMLGATKLGERSMIVRRLSPQEDKLDLTHLHAPDLDPLARYLGALAGAAHRRGATSLPKKPWTRDERSMLLDRAIVMAQIHEGAYLAMCKVAR